MPYQPNDLLSRHFQESGHDLINKVEEQLNLVSPNSPNIPIYRDMILTVLRMAQEDHNRWNAKITLQALRELEHAFRVLEQFKGAPQSHGFRLGPHTDRTSAIWPGPGAWCFARAFGHDGHHGCRWRHHGRGP
jgi:hypothetical protein